MIGRRNFQLTATGSRSYLISRFSLQTEEEYRSYYNVNVPTSQFYASLSP